MEDNKRRFLLSVFFYSCFDYIILVYFTMHAGVAKGSDGQPHYIKGRAQLAIQSYAGCFRCDMLGIMTRRYLARSPLINTAEGKAMTK